MMNKMRKGFSYIETLLALLIMSLALFPALEGFRQSARSQLYVESRYTALAAADSLVQTMADALRRDKDAAQVFLKESGSFPLKDFACRLYISDEGEEGGYRVFTAGEPPKAEDFVQPVSYQSGIEDKEPDLRIGETVSYLNSDISAEEKDGRLCVTISAQGGKDFYYLTCEGGAYTEFYFEKRSEPDVFIMLEAEEGKEIELEAAEGIYIVMTEKKKESKFLVLDVYEKKENRRIKRFVRFV